MQFGVISRLAQLSCPSVTPFQALYGRSGRLPSHNSKSTNGFCTEADRTQTLSSSWDVAKENQKINHERNQQRSTKRQDANVLAPGTSVMLLKPGLLSSLEPRWTPGWAIVLLCIKFTYLSYHL